MCVPSKRYGYLDAQREAQLVTGIARLLAGGCRYMFLGLLGAECSLKCVSWEITFYLKYL